MCSVREGARTVSLTNMRDEQKVIAGWIERIATAKGWSYAEWAKKAELGAATTITRALKPDYESVTSIPTLHQLAVAADRPSVLDFLAKDVSSDAGDALPTVEQLEEMVRLALMEVQPGAKLADYPPIVASSIRDQLELLQAHGVGDPVDSIRPGKGTSPGKGAQPDAPTT